MKVRACVLTAVFVVMSGCAHERERPEAAGVVFAPDSVSWAEYDAWRKEIALAVDPNARDAYPGSPFLSQSELLHQLDAIDAQRQAHHWQQAQAMIFALSERLRQEDRMLTHCVTTAPVADHPPAALEGQP